MFLFFIFSVQCSMFSSCGRNHPLDDKRPHFLCSAQCAPFPHVTDELRFQKLYLIMIFSVGLGPPSTSPSGFGLHLSLSIEACSQEYTLDKEYYFHISTFSSSDWSQYGRKTYLTQRDFQLKLDPAQPHIAIALRDPNFSTPTGYKMIQEGQS